MKIKHNDRVVFCFPSCLVINRLAAEVLRLKLKKRGIKLLRKQVVLFVKEIKRYKKSHSDWNVVEIDKKDGCTLKLKI